jgi:acetyltransferase-like isoleucine patch superfamily enzyme
MRTDHRPYPLKRLLARIETAWVNHFLRPQADAFGTLPMVMKPWHVRLHGSNIRIGEQVHIIAASDRKVALTTWNFESDQGHITVGDYCLICPAVRIDSANAVTIGDNCMLAAGAYLSDADWHDHYDRTRPVGKSAPIVLKNNVWIGEGAMVSKGVTIGENSIVGARALVTRDVPANTVVGGNPAAPIKTLDPAVPLRTRADLLNDPAHANDMDKLERYVLGGNSYLNWLRTRLKPNRGD